MKKLKFILFCIFLATNLIAAENSPSSLIIGHWTGMPQKNTALEFIFEKNKKLTWIVSDNGQIDKIEAQYEIKQQGDVHLIKIHKFKNTYYEYQILKGIIKFLDKDKIKMYGEYFKNEKESKYPSNFGEGTVFLMRKDT